jgi:competence protein ComEC
MHPQPCQPLQPICRCSADFLGEAGSRWYGDNSFPPQGHLKSFPPLAMAWLAVVLSGCLTRLVEPDRPTGRAATAVAKSAPSPRSHTIERATEVEQPPSASKLVDCSHTRPMKVHFFDVGQALAVLVELPGGETILVDVGESPTRPGCGGDSCLAAHEHLLSRLGALVPGGKLSMVWITHQHSDHLGGAEGVFGKFRVRFLVDNGQDSSVKQVERLHQAARSAGAMYQVVDPGHADVPLDVLPPVTLRAVVGADWPSSCPANKNDCSIGLRIQYCSSSVLFVGDAEGGAEAAFEIHPSTLLQAGHHGSDTSSTSEFLARVRPKYVVISSGKPGEGLNRGYCHPRLSSVERLTAATGRFGKSSLRAFNAAGSCKHATEPNWNSIPVSDRVFSTARDGDVTLTTMGDGLFVREK